MKTFKFYNNQNTLVVEVETDSLTATQDNITIQDINYISGDRFNFTALGFKFEIGNLTTYTELKTFASDKNMNLDIVDGQTGISTSVNTGTALSITTTSLSEGTIGSSYSQTLTKAGGVGTVIYSINTGTLPTGVTLSSSGIISGTPAALTNGTYTVVYKVTDAFNQSATKSLDLVINPNT